MVLHCQSIRIRIFRQQPHHIDADIHAALRFNFFTIHGKMDIQCCKSIIYGIGQGLLCCFISFTSLFQQFCCQYRIVRQGTFRSIYRNSEPVVRVDITVICIISIRDLSAFRQNHIQISLLQSFLRTLAFFTVSMLLHPTGQLPVSIAKRAMGVVFVLGKRTGQSIRIHRFLHRFKAGVRMLMLQNLNFAADQITSIIKAVRCVFVKNYFRLVTDQLGFACFRYGIAAVGMLMSFNLRQRAPEVPIFIVAGRIMPVNDIIRISTRQIFFAVIAGIVMLMEIQAFDGTHRLGPGGSYLRVTSLRVGVFGNLTCSLFQGNGGKDQCVDCAEHYHTGKACHNPVPSFFSLMFLRIFLCAPQSIFFHITITFLPISIFRSQPGARPGKQFFQQSVHQRRSRLWCCGNPPK